MSKTWLIIDVSYMSYRAFHTMGALSSGDMKTGVIYGFLRSVLELKDLFGTEHIAFCFDSIDSKRKELYPDYKNKRHTKEMTMEEKVARNAMREQVKQLRLTYLPTIGFKNIFREEGYESDDIMASIVKHLPEEDDAVIVTADRDLWQCMTPRVSFFNPDTQKRATYRSFMEAHNGLPPSDYWKILALAGCATDEVKGIPSIGKKSALQFLSGTLKETSKKYAAIVSRDGADIYRRNRALVKLPFALTPVYELQEDTLSRKGWDKVCNDLGMKSIKDRGPFSTREQRRQRGNGFGL